MRTVYSLLDEAAERYGERPALHQGGNVYSWNEYRRAAQEIAVGLRGLGLGKGDVVALDSETRAEFYLADLGIVSSGAIAAALYTSYPAAERVRTLRACRARAVIVENPNRMAALKEAADPPLAVHWLLLTGECEGALPVEGLRKRGRRAMHNDADLFERIRHDVSPLDPAILYLTSGATGEPKMGLVTHGALVANVDIGPQVLPIGPEDSTIAFLPSAHIVQRLVIELLPLRCGMPVWFTESLMQMQQDLQVVRPTVFVAPPRLWERVHASIQVELRKRPRLVQKMFREAVALGLEAARRAQRGQRLSLPARLWLRLADRVMFRKMRSRFGGRLRVCGSGSAPLGKYLAEFFMGIGMPVIEGYGLTEGGVVAMNPLSQPKPGSVGTPLPGIEMKVADDGELLISGPTLFAGYYDDPEATAHVLRDGWLATGDLAEIDTEGYIYIIGRKKEMIVSSTGVKIYPSKIESLFRLEPIVSHVLLVGDGLPYLTALFTLNPGATHGRQPAIELEHAVARVNRRLAPFEQIRKYRILERDFSIDTGELTATMKVRRSRALENFSGVVQELYAGRE